MKTLVQVEQFGPRNCHRVGLSRPRLPSLARSSSRMPTFTYTLIPCDENEPFQEFTMSAPADLEENIGCLTKALNKHYTRVAPMVAGAGKQAAMDAMKEQLKEAQADAVKKLAQAQQAPLQTTAYVPSPHPRGRSPPPPALGLRPRSAC